MNSTPDYFSVGASIVPSGSAASAGPPAAEEDATRADGTQSFQDLDISSSPMDGAAGTGSGAKQPESPFEVTVTEPARQGEGMQAFIQYRVNTKTTLPQYRYGAFTVTRRYRDFDWLFQQFCEKWPGIIVPPLPEKAIAGKVVGAHSNPEFIESRRRHLELFLHRVTSHPELQQAECLQVFLEASEEALEAAKNASKAAGSRWGQLLSEGWWGIKSYYGKSIGAAPDGVVDRQCDEHKAFVQRLEAQLTALHKAADRLVKRHKAESGSMTELGLAFSQLGSNGDNDLSRDLASGLSHLGVTCDRASRSLEEQAEREGEQLDEPLRDILRRLQQCKMAIQARESAFNTWQAACSALDAKRTRMTRAVGAEAGDGRTQQMEVEIAEGEAMARQAETDYEQIKDRTNREMGRFGEVCACRGELARL